MKPTRTREILALCEQGDTGLREAIRKTAIEFLCPRCMTWETLDHVCKIIPQLKPITRKVRKLDPEAWK